MKSIIAWSNDFDGYEPDYGKCVLVSDGVITFEAYLKYNGRWYRSEGVPIVIEPVMWPYLPVPKMKDNSYDD